MTDRPEWVTNFQEIEFPADWADSEIDRYPQNVIESSDISPLRNSTIDINNLESISRDQLPEVATGSTVLETMKALFDLLDSFSNNIPKSDREIYDVYQTAEESNNLKIDAKFSEFYRFCRQFQYNKITDTRIYKIVSSGYDKYTISEDPEIGSTWLVNRNDRKYNLRVQSILKQSDNDLIDPLVYGQVVEIKMDKESSVDVGDFVTVDPGDLDHRIPK